MRLRMPHSSGAIGRFAVGVLVALMGLSVTSSLSSCTPPKVDTLRDPPVVAPGDVPLPAQFTLQPGAANRSEDVAGVRYADLSYITNMRYGAANARGFYLDAMREHGWQWSLSDEGNQKPGEWRGEWRKDGNRAVVVYTESRNPERDDAWISYLNVQINTRR